MINNPRSEFEDTPEGRIAAAADTVVRAVRRKYDSAVPGVSGNRIYPDVADFRQGLALYVQREVLAAEFEIMRKHGTVAEALKKMAELNAVELEISRTEGQ